jgi:aryl-alcohol dehydrogenase
MEIQAAILRRSGEPFEIETLRLDDPRPDEVLVRIVAAGLCHTDISIAQGLFPPLPPIVLGHEGAGVIEKVGADVRDLTVGDHVVLSFDSCGDCPACRDDHPVFCAAYTEHNGSGRRVDGTHTLQSDRGPVGGNFLGQSSFATHALARERNAVRVRRDAPLELLGPLGCGVQTGVGTVLNIMKPGVGESLAVFGCGAVGLSAVMGARIAGCAPIIAVDKVPSRLALAAELGATHTVNAGQEDPLSRIDALGGVRYVVEASGVPAVLAQAMRAVGYGGVLGMLGGHPPKATLEVNIQSTLFGKTLIGVVEGDVNPHKFVPYLVDLYLEGRLPIDKLANFYELDEINLAVKDSLEGKTVKPMLKMAIP